MVRIRYFDGAKHVEIEVTEEFASEYAAMEHRDKLIERKGISRWINRSNTAGIYRIRQSTSPCKPNGTKRKHGFPPL